MTIVIKKIGGERRCNSGDKRKQEMKENKEKGRRKERMTETNK